MLKKQIFRKSYANLNFMFDKLASFFEKKGLFRDMGWHNYNCCFNTKYNDINLGECYAKIFVKCIILLPFRFFLHL
jgi:hypothetical protein